MKVIKMVKSSIEMVKDFMDTFQQEVPKEQGIPDDKVVDLRLHLIFEELHELAVASGAEVDFAIMLKKKADEIIHRHSNFDGIHPTTKDIKEALDALCDLRYVVDGTVLAYGLHEVHDDAFKEVHNSNMSKSCSSSEEAMQTVQEGNTKYTGCHIVQNNDTYLVFTDKRKLVKSVNYKPANLDQFIK